MRFFTLVEPGGRPAEAYIAVQIEACKQFTPALIDVNERPLSYNMVINYA